MIRRGEGNITRPEPKIACSVQSVTRICPHRIGPVPAGSLIEGNGLVVTWCVGHLVEAMKPRFIEQFPDVHLDTDRLIVDDDDLITAGGLMAWVDLGLRIIDRFLGPPAMIAMARHFLVDTGGREQRWSP